jgi:uncharacterized protein (TIGR02594 family)
MLPTARLFFGAHHMDLQRLPAFSWYLIARKELGVKELQGIADNPRIVEYHSTTTLRATDDEVPWCSSYVNWVVSKAGYTPTRSAAARSWAKWGQVIDKPVKGCIVVLTRKGGGHVGFYESSREGVINVLGGNQDDAVNIKPYLASRLICYVIPKKMSIEDETVYAVLRALA